MMFCLCPAKALCFEGHIDHRDLHILTPPVPTVRSSDLQRPLLVVRREQRRLPAPYPDRVRPVDRVCGVQLLPQLLQLRRRGADRMTPVPLGTGQHLEGFEAPIHGASGRRSCSAAHRAGSPSSTARSPPQSASGFSSGWPVSCSGPPGTASPCSPPGETRTSRLS